MASCWSNRQRNCNLHVPQKHTRPHTNLHTSFVSIHPQDEKLLNASSSWQLDAFVDRMWELSGPILNNMGFSGLLGACAAAALKVGLSVLEGVCSRTQPPCDVTAGVLSVTHRCRLLAGSMWRQHSTRELRCRGSISDDIANLAPKTNTDNLTHVHLVFVLCLLARWLLLPRVCDCCAQWVGRTLAASVGLGLVLVQVLSHYGVITVNWSIVHKQARQVLDTTRDG